MKLSSLVFFVLLSCLFGCSSQNQIKVLSFFFDGVPNPSREAGVHPSDTLGRKDTTAIKQSTMGKIFPRLYFHAPYKQQECSQCHDRIRMGKLNKSLPELCYQCHDDFATKFKVLHGPVGGGQCIMCHSPHQSMNEKLLIRKGQALCLFCHDSEQVMAAKEHQDIKDASCTDCHNPHGGDERFILR